MSGFTPGPWGKAGPVDGDWLIGPSAEFLGKGFAEVFGPDVATAEANARLIAAAPDLFDVLSRLADFPFSHQGPAEGPLAYILNEAKTVLAKAGEGA